MGRFKAKPGGGKSIDDLEAMPYPPNLASKDVNLFEEMQQQHPTVISHYRSQRGGVYGVKFRPNMKHLVSGGADGIVYLWSMHCRPNLRHPIVRPYRYVGHQGPVYAVAVSPLDNLVASASKDKSVRLWIPTVEGKSSVLKGHTGPVRVVNFNHDGQWILSGSDDKTIKIWQISNHKSNPKFICVMSGHMNWIRSAEFNANCRQVVSGSDDRTVRLWDVETHHCVVQFPDMLGEVYTARFHPDGSCIASGNSKNCIQMWDVRSKSLIQHYRANGGAINSVCFHPSGNFLLSGCEDATVKIWDLREGQIVFTLQGHDGGVRTAEFSSTGEFFASGSADEHVVLWRTNADFSCDQQGESSGNIVKKNEVGHLTCSACNCVCTNSADVAQNPLESHGNGSCVLQPDCSNSSSPPKSSQGRRSRPSSPPKSIHSPSPPTPPKKLNADTSESKTEILDFKEADKMTNDTKTKVSIHKFGNKIDVPKTHFFERQIHEHGQAMRAEPMADFTMKKPSEDFICHLCEDTSKEYKKDHYFSHAAPHIHNHVESTQAKVANKVEFCNLMESKTIGSTLEKILGQLNTFTQTFGLFEERLSHFENKMIQIEKRVGDFGTKNGGSASLFTLTDKR